MGHGAWKPGLQQVQPLQEEVLDTAGIVTKTRLRLGVYMMEANFDVTMAMLDKKREKVKESHSAAA